MCGVEPGMVEFPMMTMTLRRVLEAEWKCGRRPMMCPSIHGRLLRMLGVELVSSVTQEGWEVLEDEILHLLTHTIRQRNIET